MKRAYARKLPLIFASTMLGGCLMFGTMDAVFQAQGELALDTSTQCVLNLKGLPSQRVLSSRQIQQGPFLASFIVGGMPKDRTFQLELACDGFAPEMIGNTKDLPRYDHAWQLGRISPITASNGDTRA